MGGCPALYSLAMNRRSFGLLTALTAVPAAAQPAIFLADDTRPPHVSVSWPTRDGKTSTIEGERRYQSSAQKSPLGHGIDCYVALGGTRLNKGLGDAHGAGVLVGLYKADPKKPFFENIAENGVISITLDHVYMNQPAEPHPKTVLMHVRYMLEDLQACGISGNGRNLINTADPEDAIKERTNGASARFGALDGKGDEHGKVETKVEADGSITMTVKFPYPLLRHTEDPYKRTNPGGFFEPNHFHVEVELVPAPKQEEAKTPPPEKKPENPGPKDEPGKPASPK
jgi:hypothetical protein